DLGYKRDRFGLTLKQTDIRMPQLRGQTIRLRARNGHERERVTLSVAKDAVYMFVVVSALNITTAKLQVIEKTASSLFNTKLYVLTRGCHPNDLCSKEEVKTHIAICADAFQGIEQEIKRVIG